MSGLEAKLLADEPIQDDIGKALLGETTHVNGIYMDDDGLFKRKQASTYELTGDAAMRFLGLPPRKHNLLTMFDHRKIHKRFGNIIEEYIKTGQNQNELFWKNLRIRVWNVKNIGQFTAHTKHSPSVEYAGDVFAGNALEGFLPNEEKSNRYNEYRVQLLSVTVTEDMHSAHN